jgi:hypothetical protein
MPGFFTWKPRNKRAASVEATSTKQAAAGSSEFVAPSWNGHGFLGFGKKETNGGCLPHSTSMGQKIAERVELLSRLNQVWEDQHRSFNRKQMELANQSACAERPHTKVRFREQPLVDGKEAVGGDSALFALYRGGRRKKNGLSTVADKPFADD